MWVPLWLMELEMELEMQELEMELGMELGIELALMWHSVSCVSMRPSVYVCGAQWNTCVCIQSWHSALCVHETISSIFFFITLVNAQVSAISNDFETISIWGGQKSNYLYVNTCIHRTTSAAYSVLLHLQNTKWVPSQMILSTSPLRLRTWVVTCGAVGTGAVGAVGAETCNVGT